MAAKKFWNIFRVAFFMMRKGLISKQDMNLIIKRGKLLGKLLGDTMFQSHSSATSSAINGRNTGFREYEFSCANSPNPIFVRANSKRKHGYFSCIGASSVDETDHQTASPITMLPRIECSPQCTYRERHIMPSPFSVRISNFSSVEEEDGLSSEVDDQAEEFIKRFYQQLLQCQMEECE